MKRICFIFLLSALLLYAVKAYAYGNIVSLTADSIQIDKSTTYTINVIGKEEGMAFAWSSSNSNIVKVNAATGKIKAVKDGQAIVTCTITGKGVVKQSLTCKVSVGKATLGPNLNKTNLNLKIGEQFDINVWKKIANSKYKFVSSNKAVIKVNASTGLVTAVDKGDAYITCTITSPDKHIVVLRCVVHVTETDNNIIWEDDFNSSSIKSSNWSYEYGYVRNSELQEYTDSSQNAFIRDGNLVIKAMKGSDGKWTSASLHTNNKIEVGNVRIEARVKLPKTSGAFPAFWMLGADFEEDYKELRYLGDSWPEAREIDIFEAFGDVMDVQGGVFFLESPGATALTQVSGKSQQIDITKYHVYAIEKDNGAMNFYCDDKLYYSHVITDNGLKEPFFMLLNLAVGAAGGIPDQNTNEMEMLVDYVRVTTLQNHTHIVPEAISLDKDILSGEVGDVIKINSEILPLGSQNKTVIWKSSDTEVAKVYGGYVHMNQAGTCQITATTYNGLTATCKVTIKE
jgi:uncharacterized protein YjdB